MILFSGMVRSKGCSIAIGSTPCVRNWLIIWYASPAFLLNLSHLVNNIIDPDLLFFILRRLDKYFCHSGRLKDFAEWSSIYTSLTGIPFISQYLLNRSSWSRCEYPLSACSSVDTRMYKSAFLIPTAFLVHWIKVFLLDTG